MRLTAEQEDKAILLTVLAGMAAKQWRQLHCDEGNKVHASEKHTKADGSLYTQADLLTDQMIRDGLRTVLGAPIISEEISKEQKAEALAQARKAGAYWCVDSIDGTYEFYHGGNNYRTQISFIQNGVPVFGAVYFPELQCLYYTKGGASYLQQPDGTTIPLAVKPLPAHEKPSVTFQKLPDDMIVNDKNTLSEASTERFAQLAPTYGNTGLEDMDIARGESDIHVYPKGLNEWDIAPRAAILAHAGGAVLEDVTGRALSFGASPSFKMPQMIVGAPSSLKSLHLIPQHTTALGNGHTR